MKSLLLAFAAFAVFPAYGAEIFSIRSDKADYSQGEVPVLQASVTTRPVNSDFEFDVVSELNAEALPVERVTDFEFFASAPGLAAGAYTWESTLVLQDKRYARDLKTSISYFGDRIEAIDADLATETDPEVIENLEAQKARYVSLKSGAASELANIRTPVKAATLQFTIQ